jgi:glycerophosphoryl diester phosphodiesterase
LALVGHRGVRAGPEAENTLAAFDRALSEGAVAVELDVRLCATGEAVVFHDPDLKRATNGTDTREVRHVPYSELASMRLFGGQEGAPLLQDVLELARDRGAGVNVEMKHDLTAAGPLVNAVVHELGRAAFDVLVSSFDPRLLWRVKARAPSIRIALLTTSERKWSLPLARLAARSRFLYAVHLERTQVRANVVRVLQRRGVRIGVWTVNDAKEATAMRKLGVDWLITDNPGALAS